MSDENFSPEFGSPYQVLVDHCESGGLKFQADRELKGVFFSVRGEAAIYDLSLLITHDDEILQICVTIPVAAKDVKIRPLVAEFTVRANHHLGIGNFDFDMDDGAVRYHLGHAFGDRGLDDTAVGRLVATALGTADRYFPALMRIMYGGHTPADAVYLSELDYHTEAGESEDRPTAQSRPAAPATSKAAADKQKPRRPRKSPRLKSTQELPGLFDTKAEERGSNGGKPAPEDNPPPSSAEGG